MAGRLATVAALWWAMGCADAPVQLAATAATADAALTDAALDVRAPDAATDARADAPVRDGNAWAAALVGAWKDCSGTMTLSADGSFDWSAAEGGCQIRGGWTATVAQLSFAATSVSPECGQQPVWLLGQLAYAFAGDLLAVSHPLIFGGIHRFGRQEVVRQRWNLQANIGAAVMDLCFTAQSGFYDGHFASKDCSFLACGGAVSEVKQVGAETHIWTHCAGDCPCAAVLVVQTKTQDAMAGHWSVAHCKGAMDGTFSGQLGIFPQAP